MRGLPRVRSSPTALAAHEKAMQCLELRKAGATWDQIGARGIYADKGAAWRAVMTILDRQKVEMGEQLRTLENARLDTALLAIWPAVQHGDLQAIDRMLRIEAQRARLYGIEAPVKTEISGQLAVFTISIDRAGADFDTETIDAEVRMLGEHTNGNGNGPDGL